ncbi:MAG: helix-turn-helix transcriptional regulator [Gammaproteobacteria bacterium]|nr:helix-turn-helix transcriptional regulator [Gammaproteobacteria bacterium]
MNIRERRLANGWSQEELARHSGLSTRTIQRIETGHKASLESLKSLAAVFETSISTLAQEQTMTDQQGDNDVEPLALLKIEREAIEFAQSILNGPQRKDKDLLSKLERDAISYAKQLLRRFNKPNS